jgi:hypothetical protein
MTNRVNANATIAAQYPTTGEYLKAGHGKHNVCDHPSTWAARQACRMARRAASAGVVITPAVERTLTVMFASATGAVHYISRTADGDVVTACNGRSIKMAQFATKSLDYVATCKNCAKLEIMSTESLSH